MWMFQIFSKRKFFYLMLLLAFHHNVKAKSSITMTTGDSHYNPDYFDNFTYFVKNGKAHMDIVLKKPLIKGWHARISLQRRLGNSQNFQNIFSTTLDVCNLVNMSRSNLFKKWYKNVLKYGNFLHQCPLKAGHYYLRGWQFNDSLAPPFLTSGSYCFETYNLYGSYGKPDEVFIMSFRANAIIITK